MNSNVTTSIDKFENDFVIPSSPNPTRGENDVTLTDVEISHLRSAK